MLTPTVPTCPHRHLRCSRGACIIHTLCIPLTTTIVVTVRRDMMTMSEIKTNETMQKTKNKMDDASKCVSLAPRL